MSTFKDMTNAELKEACNDFGLEVKAKNPAKPNKEEYLTALDAFKATQDATHGVEEVKEEEVVTPPKPGARKVQSAGQLMKLDLFKKDRVIVHDQQESQTKDEMVSISWGNRRIGGQTDWVDVASGEPQSIRRGAINNLKEATMVTHVSKAKGGASQARKKRFIVVSVDNLTPAEFEALRAQQAMRNSKIA